MPGKPGKILVKASQNLGLARQHFWADTLVGVKLFFVIFSPN
jgi:hypothetical protein